MNIYDFSKTMKVFFCGGSADDQESLLGKLQDGLKNGIETAVHPKELERQQRLNNRRFRRTRDGGYSGSAVGIPPKTVSRGNGKYNNSVIFVSGGFGFGTKDDKFFEDILTKVNELLEKNNSKLVFVRGCNDDPSYFTEKKFDYSNIIFAEDYSIVKLDGFDCLCVGGSMPIDRQWRIEQGKRLGRHLFFEGCNTTFNQELIDEAVNDNNIAVIVSSDAPTFLPPYVDNSRNSKWVEGDKNIIRDMTEQRLVMDHIYGEVTKLNKKPYVWCYYSPNEDGNTINNTRYMSSSSPYSMYDVNNICEDVFGHFLNGENDGGKKKKEFLKKISATADRIGYARNENRVVAVEPFNPYDNAARGINFEPANLIGELGIDGGEPIGTLDHPAEAATFEQRADTMAARLRDAYNIRMEDLQPVAVNQIRAENDYTIRYALDDMAITTDAVTTFAVTDTNQGGTVHE